MSKRKKIKNDRGKKFKFKGIVPDLDKYIGKTVNVGGEDVLIHKVVGNLTKVAFYEINGTHLINMLRFHAQMCGDKSITEDQFEKFEQIHMEVITKRGQGEGSLNEKEKRH